MKISIIIPAYNEEKYIPRCMEGIKNQSYRNFEIIVVDNNSNDKTVLIAKKYTDKVYIIPDVNIAGLRNHGAKKAEGEVLAFLDADCIPNTDWLKNIYQYFSNHSRYLLGGPCIPPDDGTWVEKAWYFTSTKSEDKSNYVGSANLIIEKSFFDLLAGFDRNIETGEDYDLCVRAIQSGIKIKYLEKLYVIHLRDAKTLKDRFLKEIWHGKNTYSILTKKLIYLPFWSSTLFVLLILSLLISLITINFVFLIYVLIIIFIFLFLVSLRRSIISNNYKYLFQLIIINFFYLAGRSLAIYYVARDLLNLNQK